MTPWHRIGPSGYGYYIWSQGLYSTRSPCLYRISLETNRGGVNLTDSRYVYTHSITGTSCPCRRSRIITSKVLDHHGKIEVGQGLAHFRQSLWFPRRPDTAVAMPTPRCVDENRGSHIDRGSRTKPWKPSYIRVSALPGSIENIYLNRVT